MVRRGGFAVGFSVLGALIAIGLALLSAARFPHRNTIAEEYCARDGAARAVFVRHETGWAFREWQVDRRPANTGDQNRRGPSVPSWVPTPAPADGSLARAIAFGWPLPCLKWEETGTIVVKPGPLGPIQTTQTMSRGDFWWHFGVRRGDLRLPRMPIWSGLMTDAAVLGSIAAFCAFGTKALRKLARRSDACGACGYDLRGITDRCPECGREIA